MEKMRVKNLAFFAVFMAFSLTPLMSEAMEIGDQERLKKMAAVNNVTCILVFGDSSVDPGNNNVLHTTMKSNFLPYGKDFFNGHPTGRFSNGRLATDFIAEAIGFSKTVPAFLDRKLKAVDLMHGVSFASAASGYDDLTANLSNVLSVTKQVEYFMHYKIHLGQSLGKKRAEFIIRNGIVIMSMGTNDFLQNYYLEPTRSNQFSLEQYQNFLVSCMSHAIQGMHRLGTKRMVIVGVPPLGCMPLVKTLFDKTTCVESYNKVAYSFNSKIKAKLANIKARLGMNFAFVDVFAIILNAVKTPTKYALTETSKGCCGTGLVEYGDSCKGLSTCNDPEKYVFWDAVHPTEKMYKIIADEAIKSVESEIFT